MSVAVPVIASMDVVTLRIYLLQGVTTYHPVEDIYKEVRNLRKTDESLRVVDMPVSAFGNIAKGGGKYTPRYLQFNNGWRVVPYDEAATLYISGEQITDDGQSGPACLDMSTIINPIIIHYEPPSAEIVRDEVSLRAIAFMSFNDRIAIDVINGDSIAEFTGDPDLLGNSQYPVNNLADALTISDTVKLHNFYIAESMVLDVGNLVNCRITGRSHVLTEIVIEEALQCEGVTIENCTISGVLDGGTHISNCRVGTITYVNGHIHNSSLFGNIYLDGGEDAVFINCDSVDQDSSPVIDMGVLGQDLAMPNYSGIITIKNWNDADGEIGIGLNAGMVIFDTTVTAGFVVVSGVGTVTSMADPAVILNLDGLLSKQTLAVATWDEQIADHMFEGSTGHSVGVAQFDTSVHINTDTGTAGVAFPLGTEAYPVDNLTDAVIIAGVRGLHILDFDTDYFFPNGTIIQNFTLRGKGMLVTTLTGEAGCILADCHIDSAKITGWASGIIEYSDAFMSDFGAVGLMPSGIAILARNCALEGTITLPSNYYGSMKILDCWAYSGIQVPPIVDIGHCTCDITMHNYSGGVQFINASEPNPITVLLNSGAVILHDSVTGALVQVKGVGVLNDNSVGATVSTIGLLSVSTIAEANWAHSFASQLVEDVSLIKSIENGKWQIIDNQMIFFEGDSDTEVIRFNLFNSTDEPSETEVYKRVPV